MKLGPFFTGVDMDRVAVFVDAGYLFAAGGQLLTGARTTRGEVRLDASEVAKALREFAESETKLPVLRIYWYDGTDSGPSADHNRLMWTPALSRWPRCRSI